MNKADDKNLENCIPIIIKAGYCALQCLKYQEEKLEKRTGKSTNKSHSRMEN